MDEVGTQTLGESTTPRANDKNNQNMNRTLDERMTALEALVTKMAAIQQINTETLRKTANSTNVIIRVLAVRIFLQLFAGMSILKNCDTLRHDEHTRVDGYILFESFLKENASENIESPRKYIFNIMLIFFFFNC